jgi:hypothetical protein
MKSLIITDLARTEQLDRGAMAGVRGGWRMSAPSHPQGSPHYAPRQDASIDAIQSLGQSQSVLTATANDAAFIGHGVRVDSDVSQNGRNTIVG